MLHEYISQRACTPPCLQGRAGVNVAGKARVQQHRNELVTAENERTSMSVDLCVLMDITGSMVSVLIWGCATGRLDYK